MCRHTPLAFHFMMLFQMCSYTAVGVSDFHATLALAVGLASPFAYRRCACLDVVLELIRTDKYVHLTVNVDDLGQIF